MMTVLHMLPLTPRSMGHVTHGLELSTALGEQDDILPHRVPCTRLEAHIHYVH